MLNALQSAPLSTFSPYCFSRAKRYLDLVVSTLAMIPALPLIAAAAFLVKLTSKGPAFFRHRRLGSNGNEINVLKIRTMRHDPSLAGQAITTGNDLRVTWIGHILRKWKLDELPQLLNVFRGEMSLVGPRPDSLEYIATLSPQQKMVLYLTPGITSPASIEFRDEEQLLSTVPREELNTFYITRVLPRKIELELNYARQASLLGDLQLLVRTVLSVLSKKKCKLAVDAVTEIPPEHVH
jgi:lipopolysaccharide/colanic/teichoic acid biosynthesis glycosyltransferase